MSDLDALLAGIVAHPHESLRWLVLADWLQDHGQPERAELVQLHRELLRTAADPDAHPDRAGWHARLMELLRAGVEPCVPRHMLVLSRGAELAGGVELAGVFVPPGSYRMGSPESEAGREEDEAAHVVTLERGFFAGVHPVTQAQWVAVMGTNPSHYLTDGSEWDQGPVNEQWRHTQSRNLPVESVSWDDAVSFCHKLSALTDCTVRLPTEAEWEYACRAGTSTAYYWGEELNSSWAHFDWSGSYAWSTRQARNADWHGPTSEVGCHATKCLHPWGLGAGSPPAAESGRSESQETGGGGPRPEAAGGVLGDAEERDAVARAGAGAGGDVTGVPGG